MKRTLAELHAGESAYVSGYTRDEPSFLHQLLALGLTPGARVDVVRFTPLGDPLQVCVRGTQLFLRKTDAKNIFVEKLG